MKIEVLALIFSPRFCACKSVDSLIKTEVPVRSSSISLVSCYSLTPVLEIGQHH